MGNKNFPKVTIVIPNWNGKDDTLECLASIGKLEYPPEKLETFVVDNGSKDNSVKAIKLKFPWARVFPYKKNYGYAGGLNRGIKGSNAKYVLLLNNDTILARDMLKNLVWAIEKNRDIVAVGPKVYFYDKKNTIEKTYGEINPNSLELKNIGRGQREMGQYEIPKKVEAVAFCAVLTRRALFKTMGGIEEKFFHHCEDVDFFVRLRETNYKIMFVPSAHVWHKGSKSLPRNSPQNTYYLIRNNLYLKRKFKRLSFYNHFKTIRFLMSSLFLSLFNKSKSKSYKAVFLGIRDFYIGRMGKRQI